MRYAINGKTGVGWRIDKIAEDEGEALALGLGFLRSYVAFVREKQTAEMIVALLNDATAMKASKASARKRPQEVKGKPRQSKGRRLRRGSAIR